MDRAGNDRIGFSDYTIAVLAIVIWGGSFPALKYSLAWGEPSLILVLRFFFAVFPLAVGCRLEGTMRLPAPKELPLLLFMSFQGIFFQHGLHAVAMKTAGAGSANWMMVASPALVALIARIFLKEKLSKTGIAGLLLAVAGIVCVLARGTVKGGVSAGSFGSQGDWLVLFSVFNWAVYLVVSRKYLKNALPPAFSIFWELFFAFLYALAASFIVGTDYSRITDFTMQTWIAVIFLGALSSGFAYLLWYKALSVFPVARLAIFQFLQPITGMLVSYLLIGERYTIWLAAGAVMIVSGICLVNKR
ncbi:MAG: DMT family transporter [Synergistes sp.]|nr:DMT family transporter [Synergistes sp.]